MEKDKSWVYLTVGIVLGILALLMVCMLVCGFNQLRIAINVVDASADFIRKTKRIILVPVIYFFAQILIFITFLFCMACIWSMGDITVKTGTINASHQLKTSTFPKGKYEDFIITALVMFFGLLWILAFFNAQQSFIVMVSASTYYFDSNKEKDGDANVSMGVKFAWVYHIGSLAFGSFIIALIEFIRIVFMTIAEQAEKASGNNPAVKCAVCVANCLLACIEKITDYINKAAYCYMAVSGDGFCTSAWNGFLLNMKHALEFAWAKVLAELFIFTGKLSLVICNCGFLYITMKFFTKDLTGPGAVTSIWGPIVLVGFITFIAASVFLGLFSNTVLALMTCLCIDVDLNGPEPKYGPPTFHDAIININEGKQENAIAKGGLAAGQDQENAN